MIEIVLVCLLALALSACVAVYLKLRRVQSAYEETRNRFRTVVDIDAERQRVSAEMTAERQRVATEITAERQRASAENAALQSQRATLTAELQRIEADLGRLRSEFAALDEECNLQSFGFYKPRYEFSNLEQYQAKLDEIRDQQKVMLKEKTAAVCKTEWEVNGSKAAGRKQINQTLKLMLRAFNGECDANIAKVKYNNVRVMESRILKAWETINSLAEVQTCTIARPYMELKLHELYLVHEYAEKVQEEKEVQRRIKEQMREEEVALRELEKARIEAEKEETRFAEALRRAQEEAERASGQKQQKLLAQIAELQKKLTEAHAAKERAVSRAQMTRSGHVYIISNIGSFGENVYKIGMTRRLDPMDRVKELGDASVPFEFDVHAIIFTEDAPRLENELHKAFHHRRVNRVNERKEFFRVSIAEVARHVRDHHGCTVEIVHEAEAREYRKTLSMNQADPKAPPPLPAPKQTLARRSNGLAAPVS